MCLQRETSELNLTVFFIFMKVSLPTNDKILQSVMDKNVMDMLVSYKMIHRNGTVIPKNYLTSTNFLSFQEKCF